MARHPLWGSSITGVEYKGAHTYLHVLRVQLGILLVNTQAVINCVLRFWRDTSGI